MKRIAILILAASMLLVGLVVPAPAAAATPACGANTVEFRAYSAANWPGANLLGVQCENSVNWAFDSNFGDGGNAFQGNDDNAAKAFKFWNDTPYTWCLAWYQGTGFSGVRTTYTIGGHAHLYVNLSSTQINRMSSMQAIWKQSASYPCSDYPGL